MSNSLDNIRLRMVLVALVVFAAFCNTLNHGFLWDDLPVIAANPILESLGNIPRFFLMEDIADGSTGYYRPMTYISFALDRALWGLNPVGFNITNLALHILVTLLFYRLLALLFQREDLALAAALIFALHPITVETVSFHAGGRNTLLSACFALASFLLYLKGKRIPALIFFAAGILSKEFALLMPALFLLYDLSLNRDKLRWSNYLPYLAVTAGYLALRSSVVASNANLLQAVNLAENFWIVPQTVIGYLKLMLWPFALKTMYDVNNQVTWSSFILHSVLVLALVLAALLFRKRREVLFALTMFLLFLLPVSNLLPLGTAMMADRYAYFALFGFSLGLGYLVCLAPKRVALALTLVICLLFLPLDLKRNGFWQDDLTLFSQMIQDAPQMCVGYQNLGYAHHARENFPEATKYLAQAQSKKDLSAKILSSNALTMLELERPDLALSALHKAVELEPGNPEVYLMASRVLEEQGNQPLAQWHRDRAQALAPGLVQELELTVLSANAKGEQNLARGNLIKAERNFYAALGYNPNFVPALSNMALLSARRGKLKLSRHYFARALRLEPENPALHYQLSLVLSQAGQKEQARQALERFRELDALARRQPAAP